MKTIILSVIILPALFLAGCANINFDQSQANNFDWVEHNSAVDIAVDYFNLRTRQDPNTLHTIDCVAWSYGDIDPRILTYYEKALTIKGLDPEHLTLVRKGDICVGMSVCGLYAAWGRPNEINTHENRAGKTIQYRYGIFGASTAKYRPKYVYTRNGIITSITKL